MKRIKLFLIFICTTLSIKAGEDIKLSGRIILDGGAFCNAPSNFKNSASITDVRLAAKGSFLPDWYAKIDVGFAKNKAALKDAFIQYRTNNHIFRGGYMLGYLGMDNSASTTDYLFHTGANMDETFYFARRTGLSYTYSGHTFYSSIGAFMGDGLDFSNDEQPGYSLTGRMVYHCVNSQRSLHLGTGALFNRPNLNIKTDKRAITFESKGVTYLNSPQLLGTTIEGVKSQVHLNLEGLYYDSRYFLQSEYQLVKVAQDINGTFSAQGGYIEGGVLLMGKHYGYDNTDALMVTPQDDKSLLLVVRSNITQLNNHSIRGGMQKDVSIGVNYYINRNVSLKLNYSHLWLDENSRIGENDFSMIQSRLQVKF